MSFAHHLLDGARRFCPDRNTGLSADARTTLHLTAVATEMALKACLAHHGACDTWLAAHVRHDLSRALDLTETVGLHAGVHAIVLVDQLDPHFRNGAFQQMREPFWTPGFDLIAPGHLSGLIDAVADHLRLDPDGSFPVTRDRQSSPRGPGRSGDDPYLI